jgi:phospholipase/lecithinase/hemolysin
VVGTLLGAGAQNILVANLPDLSKTPFGLSSSAATQQGLKALSAGFDSALAADLSLLGSAKGVHILDAAGLFQQLEANPGKYGFQDVTDQGILTGNPAAPGYLFWDDVHPTMAGHGVIASRAAGAIGAPEPASLTLATLGVAGIAARAWRRRRLVA